MANIYFNEFDRFIAHQVKPLAYIRYGDDFISFAPSQNSAEDMRTQSVAFLQKNLFLTTNPKLDALSPVRKGVSYLGIEFWPSGHRLNDRMRHRIDTRLNQINYASYEGLILSHEKAKKHKQLQWRLPEVLKD